MLEGHIARTSCASLLAALPGETVELNLQLLLDYTRVLLLALHARQIGGAGHPLEALLRQGLDRANTTSAKAAWFGALRSVATTGTHAQLARGRLAHRRSIPGLPLAEVDESDLAMDLAVRDVPAAEAILTAQLARIANPDRKTRFAFIVPALSRDAATRSAFFGRLKDPANRGREAWVLDAARYLHHPLRADSSAALVRSALGLVREIQQTGDIFFPKRWADATLAGHQSSAVAADVRAFIDSLPADYPPRLRWVILASADQLFRAASLTAR
jgi:aminopeptidase N